MKNGKVLHRTKPYEFIDSPEWILSTQGNFAAPVTFEVRFWSEGGNHTLHLITTYHLLLTYHQYLIKINQFHFCRWPWYQKVAHLFHGREVICCAHYDNNHKWKTFSILSSDKTLLWSCSKATECWTMRMEVKWLTSCMEEKTNFMVRLPFQSH